MEQKRRWLLTPCGLDCSGCGIRLRTEEEMAYWKTKNVDLNKIKCNGCRSERNENHWSPDCQILDCCVYKRGYEFCAECDSFPCSIFSDWEAGLEHHKRAIERLSEMKKTGVEKWFSKKSFE
jgi:hypothetical protein